MLLSSRQVSAIPVTQPPSANPAHFTSLVSIAAPSNATEIVAIPSPAATIAKLINSLIDMMFSFLWLSATETIVYHLVDYVKRKDEAR